MKKPDNQQFINLLIDQKGDQYVYGHEVSLSDPNPRKFDCSELVEWACAQLKIKPVMPDGSWLQLRHCNKYGCEIEVKDGMETPGALLFRFSGDPFEGDRPKSAHVGVSLGSGYTIEARGREYGVGIFKAKNRSWTHAALVPGIYYPGWDSEEQKPPGERKPAIKEEPKLGSTWLSVLRRLLGWVGIR